VNSSVSRISKPGSTDSVRGTFLAAFGRDTSTNVALVAADSFLRRRHLAHIFRDGISMSKTTRSETSLLAERERIWQTYRAGELDVEVATARLLQLDIAVRAAARKLQTAEPQD
jgi:hypothetical protein